MVTSILQKERSGFVAGVDEKIAGMLAAGFGEEQHLVFGQLSRS